MAKINFNKEELESMNQKIQDARTTVEESHEEFEAIQNKLEIFYAKIATGEATLEDVKALNVKLDVLQGEIKIGGRVIDVLIQAKMSQVERIESEIATATADAFNSLQNEYDDVIDSKVAPTRLAYLEALAEAGKLNGISKEINSEMEVLRGLAGADISRSYYKRMHLKRKNLEASPQITGKKESSGFGFSNTTLSKIHNSGIVPNEFY